MRTPLYATESEEKVLRAIQNILAFSKDQCRVEEYGRYREIICIAESRIPLEKFASLLRSQRILDAARSYLLKGKSGNAFKFYLNKQAALQGHASFCTFEVGESPLGAITIIIDLGECNPEAFLNWLAPETRNGKPINEEKDPGCG